jgi:hypothetical protein
LTIQPASTDLGTYRLAAATAFYQGKGNVSNMTLPLPDAQLAIRLASIGINLQSLPSIHAHTDDEGTHNVLLLVGRALAYWLNDQPGAAYSDCIRIQDILASSNMSQSSPLWRRVKLIRLQAAYKLRMFAIADLHLATCEESGVHPDIVQPYKDAIALRIREKDGVYSANSGPTSLGQERALYQGPIKIVIDPIKGRILVTTRAVASGEVLLAESPIVDLNHHGSKGVTAITVAWGATTIKSSANVAPWVVQKIMDDPSLGRCIHSLAPNANIQETNIGINDEERLEVFRNPCEIEIDLMERQVERNVFGGDGTFTLYGLGSMMSHSCKTNTIKSDVGEVSRAVSLADC